MGRGHPNICVCVCVCVLQSRIRATVWIEAVDDHNVHHLKAVEFVR